MTRCYCCSNKSFTECCEPFIKKQLLPQIPEQLMRSRYTAHVLGDIDYIKATMKGPALAEFNENETTDWIRHVEWMGLQIISSTTTDNDTVGFVDFITVTRHCNHLENFREISEFRKEDDRWYYVSGKKKESAKAPTKQGRNSPCHCGSKKKFKKCCGVE